VFLFPRQRADRRRRLCGPPLPLQVINNKARLVNQQEGRGGAVSTLIGGVMRSASPLTISGNNGARCNNCPGNGCKNCPMFGVGENPEYLLREAQKKQKREARSRGAEEGSKTKNRADL